MEKLKLTSVRLDCETLEAIDKIKRQSYVGSRSWIINRLLRLCLKYTSDKDLWTMLSTRKIERLGYKITLKIDADEAINPHRYDY